MALSGVHVACANISTANGAALVGGVQWSQTMATAGTTQAAPTGSGLNFEIRSSADIYVAVGPIPDATAGPRIFVPANETRNVLCYTGDKLAWIAA